MKTALVMAICIGAVGFGREPVKPSRLTVVSSVDLTKVNGGAGVLVCVSLIADSSTGREWLVVSGVANTHVHVSEVLR